MGCYRPWSKGNWFPFWAAAARGARGTDSSFFEPPVRAYKKGRRTSDVIPLDDNLVSPHIIFYIGVFLLRAFAHAEMLYLAGHTVAL